jgi:hypothetical protein
LNENEIWIGKGSGHEIRKGKGMGKAKGKGNAAGSEVEREVVTYSKETGKGNI